jgi:hypothetical protein
VPAEVTIAVAAAALVQTIVLGMNLASRESDDRLEPTGRTVHHTTT